VALDELSSGFTVNLSMLPSRYIPLRVAECVLFVGRAVRLLTQQRFDVTAPHVTYGASAAGGPGRFVLSSMGSVSPGTYLCTFELVLTQWQEDTPAGPSASWSVLLCLV
jgi:hypothetical protein